MAADAAAPAALSGEQALQKIATDWDAPIFFNRLEQYGVVPANDEEAMDLLKLAMVLEDQDKQKQAQAHSNVARLVKKSLHRLGVNEDPADQTAEINAVAKQAAETLSGDMLQAFEIASRNLGLV